LNKNNLIREFFVYLTLIKEGVFLKDKAAIILYMLCAPLRYLSKKIGKIHAQRLIKEVSIKNSDGLFSCGRSFTSCKAASSFYEKNIKQYFDLKEGIFIDIGAHIGKYTIRLANRMGNRGTVIAIEPEENNYKILKTNVVHNKLDNIHLLNVACFDKDGEIPLYVVDNYTTLHSIYKNGRQKKVVVKALKLDTIVAQLTINRVDLIKIDVEGAELAVIRGSRKILHKYHPKIIFEAWDKERFNDMDCLLKKFNYQIRQIDGENYLAY